jgi:hypothetical protein
MIDRAPTAPSRPGRREGGRFRGARTRSREPRERPSATDAIA